MIFTSDEVTSENHWQIASRVCRVYVDGLAQDCSNYNASALKLLQSCAKPLICMK